MWFKKRLKRCPLLPFLNPVPGCQRVRDHGEESILEQPDPMDPYFKPLNCRVAYLAAGLRTWRTDTLGKWIGAAHSNVAPVHINSRTERGHWTLSYSGQGSRCSEWAFTLGEIPLHDFRKLGSRKCPRNAQSCQLALLYKAGSVSFLPAECPESTSHCQHLHHLAILRGKGMQHVAFQSLTVRAGHKIEGLQVDSKY